MTELVFTGGRDYTDEKTIARIFNYFRPDIVHIGDCPTGLDNLVKNHCEFYGIKYFKYCANWNKHGKAAGPIRNKEMLVVAACDLLIAFPGGRGTTNCIKEAKKLGYIVLEVI